MCSDIGIEVGKKIALKAFKNPERELQKLDKGIKREVLKEYKVLLEDDKKTAVESVDPFFGRLKALFQEASDALVGKTECKAPTTCEAAEVVPSQEDALPPSPVEVAC